MIREKFEELANQLGWTYEYSEKNHVSFVSRNLPTSYHRITVNYQSVAIDLVYEFGGHNLGHINSVIKTDKNTANFSVTTKSQIQRMFSKDKQAFSIETTDPLFESKIKDLLESSAYNEIAQNTTFEPEISGVKNEGIYTINTTFYLGFKDKERSILPSIAFHKKMIDHILR